MISQMPHPSLQTEHLRAEEELVMVEATGSFKNRILSKHSVAHTRGAENHPHPILKVGFLVFRFPLSFPVQQWKDVTADICCACVLITK